MNNNNNNPISLTIVSTNINPSYLNTPNINVKAP